MIKNCYIHIPFCNSICAYCDFCKLLKNEKIVDSYLMHLEREIKSLYKDELLETIYIGGGTPSCLSLSQLNKLFAILKKIKKDKNIEYTIECNFDTITPQKLQLFRENGINRLSFGLESINAKNLALLERNESKKKVKDVIVLCKKMGFKNINVDLMYAIPGETMVDLEKDIDFVLSLNISHISTYSLIIEDHTKLAINNVDYISQDLDEAMYQLICKKLKDKYIHYEISNFSLENYQSKHNLCYWKNKNYYGFGLGASSYLKNKRINNTRSLTKYLHDEYILDYEILTKADIMSYEMILGLRLLKGVNKQEFKYKYQKNIEDVFPIKKLLQEKLICDDGNIYIPIDKLYISNEILINFIKE